MLSLSTLSLSLSIPFPILILTSFLTRIFSNERLHTHRVMVTAPAVLAAAASAPSTVPRYFQSQVEMTGKKTNASRKCGRH